MSNFVSIKSILAKNHLGSIFQYLSLLFKDPRINRFYTYYTKFYFVNNVYKHKIWQVHIAQSFRNKYVFLKGLLSNCWKNNSHHFSWHCSRRFVYCVWLCFGNIMSVATINNVHSHKFQWNFFFWRKWVVVDNIILIKIIWVWPKIN